MIALPVYVLVLAAGGPLLAPLAHEGHGGEEASPLVLFSSVLLLGLIVSFVGFWLYEHIRPRQE